jgi:hypothetical protein
MASFAVTIMRCVLGGTLALALAGSTGLTQGVVSAAPAAGTIGINLIQNGNAEAAAGATGNGTVPVPGFATTAHFTTTQYEGGGGDLNAASPGPSDRGNNYFYGGPANARSSATQVIDVASGAARIDAGSMAYTLSAWLGGYSNQDDNATLTATFLSGSGVRLANARIGPVLSADRGGVSKLLYRQKSGAVPRGTRQITIILLMTRRSGSDNDGLADDLSLVLGGKSVAPSPGPTSGQTSTGAPAGVNLIQNGNAEAAAGATGDGTVSVPGFATTPHFTTTRYVGGGGDLDATTPGPSDRGSNYFYGGPANARSNATQVIDVASGAARIDAGSVTYTLSAWLGGYSNQDDNAVLTATFLGDSGMSLASAKIGPVLSADRGGVSKLLFRQTGGTVPRGTRQIKIALVMTRLSGSDNDGLADDLSLVLR